MKHVDVPTVVQAHMEAFPHGFYSRLGPQFMTSYLREHLRSPAACAFAAVDGRTGHVVGYLLGTLDDAAHRAHKVRHSTRTLARAGAAALRRRPALWGEFLRVRALWYLRRLARGGAFSRAAPPSGPSRTVSAELLYICVLPSVRLTGIGGALHDTFVARASDAGAGRLHLVTEEENLIAQTLYEHRGWITESVVTSRDGRRLVRMIRNLHVDAA